MKVSLEVSQGAHRGKRIPIPGPQFLIGRDAGCHLRPASPMISRRHCAVLVRDGQVWLQDFGSTNGVHVNGTKVTGKTPLRDGDQIRIEPLEFVIHIEAPAPAVKKVAAPAGPVEPADDESVAAMLLDMQDDAPAGEAGSGTGGEPLANTVMEMPALGDPTRDTHADNKPGTPKKEEKPAPVADTSTAAKRLLEKYTRRRV